MSTLSIRNIVFQTLFSAILSALTFAFGFVRVYYFSRQLSVEEFGVLSLLLTFSAFLIYIFSIGSFQFLFKRTAEGQLTRRKAFWVSAFTSAGVSTLLFLAIVVLRQPLAVSLNLKGFELEIALTALATAITAVTVVFIYYHYGAAQNNFQNFLQFLRSSLWIVLAIAVSAFAPLSLVQILIVLNISLFMTMLLAFPWKDLQYLTPIVLDKQEFVELIRYCVPLLPYFAGAWGIPLIVRSQLNVMTGPQDVAIFTVAYTLMEIIFMFISTITATISPYFFSSEGDSARPGKFYNIMLKYSIVCILLIVPFVYMLRYDIIRIVASEKYLISAQYIPLLLLFPLLRVVVIVFEQYCLKLSQTIFLGIIYTIGIFLALILTYQLIPRYGIQGAIIASIISYTLIFFCLFFKQKNILDFKYLNVPAIVGLVVITGISVVILSNLDMNSWQKILLHGAVVLVSLFFLPILDTVERAKLLSFLKRSE